jgi:hypothetical protein
MEQLVGELMTAWRGPFQSQLLPPRRRERGEWIELRPSDIVFGTNHRLSGYKANALEAVNPDATVELELPDRRRMDLMIEYRTEDDPSELAERLVRYDVFVSGWAHLLDRYRPPARLQVVLFVCSDERTLRRVLETADRALTTRIAKAGTPERDWPFPGRRSILFALEPDIHRGSLRAFGLPEAPAQPRLTRNEVQLPREGLRQVQLIDPRLLPEPASQSGTRPRRLRSYFRAAPRNG